MVNNRIESERKEELAELDRKKNLRKKVLQEILESPSGREFYWDLIEQFGLYSKGFTGNSKEYYNTGKRHVALELSEMAEDADFELYVQMRKEAKGRKGRVNERTRQHK